MKKLALLTIILSFSFLLNAQEKYSVPEVTVDQKMEILYNHVIAYNVTGISFAKSQGVSALDYGKYIGKMFIPFWDPANGPESFANGIIYILAGMHPNNEMQIISQDENMLKFKLKNVTMYFADGPFLGVSSEEFIDCSFGILSVLSNHMGLDFSHKLKDGWYIVVLKEK